MFRIACISVAKTVAVVVIHRVRIAFVVFHHWNHFPNRKTRFKYEIKNLFQIICNRLMTNDLTLMQKAVEAVVLNLNKG